MAQVGSHKEQQQPDGVPGHPAPSLSRTWRVPLARALPASALEANWGLSKANTTGVEAVSWGPDPPWSQRPSVRLQRPARTSQVTETPSSLVSSILGTSLLVVAGGRSMCGQVSVGRGESYSL